MKAPQNHPYLKKFVSPNAPLFKNMNLIRFHHLLENQKQNLNVFPLSKQQEVLGAVSNRFEQIDLTKAEQQLKKIIAQAPRSTYGTYALVGLANLLRHRQLQHHQKMDTNKITELYQKNPQEKIRKIYPFDLAIDMLEHPQKYYRKENKIPASEPESEEVKALLKRLDEAEKRIEKLITKHSKISQKSPSENHANRLKNLGKLDHYFKYTTNFGTPLDIKKLLTEKNRHLNSSFHFRG